MGLEVTKETTRAGAVLDPESGKARIPNAEGGVSDDVKQVINVKFGEGAEVLSAKQMAKLLDLNGFHKEAADVRGETYKPSIGNTIKNLATSQITPLKLLVTVVVSGVTYYVAKKGLNFLAKKMGWNLFGNVVTPMIEEEPQKKQPAPRARVTAFTPPIQPTATA